MLAAQGNDRRGEHYAKCEASDCPFFFTLPWALHVLFFRHVAASVV